MARNGPAEAAGVSPGANSAGARRLRAGIVGGGRGAFIGSVHRMAAELDGESVMCCSISCSFILFTSPDIFSQLSIGVSMIYVH